MDTTTIKESLAVLAAGLAIWTAVCVLLPAAIGFLDARRAK